MQSSEFSYGNFAARFIGENEGYASTQNYGSRIKWVWEAKKGEVLGADKCDVFQGAMGLSFPL
jgi:hypothetical protein